MDSGDLSESNKTPGQHSWVGDGIKFLSGRDYINSCRLRINAIPTKARTSRGTERDRRCREGCQASETLNHVIQRCFRTNLARMRRHNAVSSYISRKLRNQGFTVQEEPQINTVEGLRKPDILAVKQELVLVVDSQVVGGQFDLRRAHNNKKNYYARNPGVTAYIHRAVTNTRIVFTTATLNWKGIWCSKSSDQLMTWCLSQKDIKTISSSVLIGGHAGWVMFNNTTTTQPSLPRQGVG